jgi:protein-tyrosine-phosphatase
LKGHSDAWFLIITSARCARAPESLKAKRLNDYDLIVAMEQVHKSAILTECPDVGAT